MEQAVLPKILAQDRKGSTWCGIRLEKIFIESEKEKNPTFICVRRGENLFSNSQKKAERRRREKKTWRITENYFSICKSVNRKGNGIVKYISLVLSLWLLNKEKNRIRAVCLFPQIKFSFSTNQLIKVTKPSETVQQTEPCSIQMRDGTRILWGLHWIEMGNFGDIMMITS